MMPNAIVCGTMPSLSETTLEAEQRRQDQERPEHVGILKVPRARFSYSVKQVHARRGRD